MISKVKASGHLVEEHGPATWSIPFSRVDGPGPYYIVPADADFLSGLLGDTFIDFRTMSPFEQWTRILAVIEGAADE